MSAAAAQLPAGVSSSGASHSGADGASASGVGTSPTGAAPPNASQMCRKRKALSEDSSDSLGLSSPSSSDDASEDDRGQDRQRRGSDGDHAFDAASSGADDAESGGESPRPDAGAAGESSAAAEVLISEDGLASRALAMFVVGAKGPAEVRKPLLAPVVTHRVVSLAIEVCKKLCDRDGKALSRSFGNFDQRVAIGWLLADAAGRPQPDRKAAHALGVKAQRSAVAAKASISAARRQALAEARAASTDTRAAQDAAEAAIWAKDADIITSVQPATTTAAPAAAKLATGARKSAQKAADESFEQRAAAAERAVLTAKRALTRAEAAEEAAEKRVDICGAQLDRICGRATKHFEGKCPRKQFPHCCFRWMRHMDQGQLAVHNAMLAWKDAQIATHEARYEWRDLLEAWQDLDNEDYREKTEDLIATYERTMQKCAKNGSKSSRLYLGRTMDGGSG